MEQGIQYKKHTAKPIIHSILYDGKGECGVVEEWKVEIGEKVKMNTVLGLVRTVQTTTAIRAHVKGIVKSILYPQGATVQNGKEVLQIEAFKQKSDAYDTAPIVESIAQLLKKRRETEKAMEAAKTEEEKSWRAIVCEEIDEKVCEKRKEMLSMYKELIFKEQQKYLGSKFAPFSISRNDADEYCKYVPRLPLDPRCIQEPEYIVTLKTLMSKEEEKSHYFPPYFCGRSTSTYPFIEKNGCRDGEPICDQYCLMFSPPLSIIAVADGCNWGTGPAEAAIRASKAFIDHMNKSRDLFRSTNLVAHLCLDGIVAAHNSIIAGPYIEGKSIGTTTLLGGVLAKVILPNQKDNEPKNIKDWVFIFASIGDCKAFLYDKKKKTVEELTPDSRGENFMDASDCGGRIGPYIDGGPDLRNLEVFMSPCHEGDIIFVCSDGVHDNFDPQMQGETPKDLGATCDTWETIDATQANSIKAEYRCKRLKQVMNIPEDTDELDLSDITETVIKYCKDMSLPSQKFMQENPGKRLPNDYNRFPGKMDHTTLVTIRVGEYESERFEEFIKEKKVEHKKQRESAEDTEDGIELLLSIKKSATEPLIVRSESTKPKLISQKSMGEAPEKTRRVVPARRRKLNTSQSNLQSTDVLLKQGRELCSVAARNYRNIYTIIEETATEVELEKYIKLTIDSSAALIDFALNLGYFEEAESLKKLVTALISIVTVIHQKTEIDKDLDLQIELENIKVGLVQFIKLFLITLQNRS